MKNKIINWIGLVSLIIAMTTGVIYIFTTTMIPIIMPLSVAAMMLCLLYKTKQQFNEGKVTKDHLRIIYILALLGASTNIIVGILQIVNIFTQ